MDNLAFNPKPSKILHIDLNSCFATIEQQANPHLRGKPIAVAAYATPNGCILAPSIEAKRYGIKTGMRVKDGRFLYPNLIVLPPDPWKYRNIHLKLRKLLADYTYDVTPKSIDEFVLDFQRTGILGKLGGSEDQIIRNSGNPDLRQSGYSDYVRRSSECFGSPIHTIAQEIKQRIKSEIGDWLTVSIGIAPNRFLAKLASSLKKPDGLDEINKDNFMVVYSRLKLTELPYIKLRNAIRLNSVGISSVVDFYHAPLPRLKAAFESINGYYWYLRLRGHEIDDIEFGRRSYGNSYALPKPFSRIEDLSPILSKLVTKMGARLRRAGYKARGIHLAIFYRDGGFWHKGVTFEEDLFDSRDIYKKALKIMSFCPFRKPVRNLAVSSFGLRKIDNLQLSLLSDVLRKERCVKAVDAVNERWGDFVVTPARMLFLEKGAIPDRIAFGGVKELEEFT